MSIARDLIDADAEKILRRLRRNGHTAYLVGGCVRDLLLGRTPKDFDIATSATPQEIKDLFRNSRIIGRRFRLAHIFFGPKIIETSTFRANPREGMEAEEGEEILIRRDNVFGTAEEDARRRDFTINGLFYDIEAEKVTDYVGGLADLEARLVRTIGDPDIRFREDPVRILRAIKFAARLDFQMEPATYAALLQQRVEIPKCAPPRVLEEIYRFLRGGAARKSMELLLETGVAQVLAPELVWMFGAGGEGVPPAGLPVGDDLVDSRARAWRVLEELDIQAAVERAQKAEAVALALPGEPVPLAMPVGPPIMVEGIDEPPPAPAGAASAPPGGDRRRPRPVEPPTNALLLAALVAPFLEDAPPGDPEGSGEIRDGAGSKVGGNGGGGGGGGKKKPVDHPRDQNLQIEEVLIPLVTRLRVSRRDAERTRQILLAQRRLSPSRRRRARPMALVRRDYFAEALRLFELLTTVRESPTDDAARWRSLWRSASGEPGTPPDAAVPSGASADSSDSAEATHKRRRRRRGGRKRRAGDGEVMLALGPSDAGPGDGGGEAPTSQAGPSDDTAE